MPIEIRELVVSIVLDDDEEKNEAGPASDSAEFRRDLVEECVEAVLTVLRDREAP